jgi:hypothetical protein
MAKQIYFSIEFLRIDHTYETSKAVAWVSALLTRNSLKQTNVFTKFKTCSFERQKSQSMLKEEEGTLLPGT